MPKLRALILIAVLALLYQGCVTAPMQEMPYGAANIGGTTYVPLVGLCDTLDIAWQWDDVIQALTLEKNGQEIKVMVDSSLVSVDNRFERLAYPILNREGVVMAPWRFKEQFIGKLLAPPKFGGEIFAPGYTIRKIVIDPGHGGRDPGAIGRGGIREKDLVLDVGRRLRSRLQSQGFEVIMTRDKDVFISLSRRADIANRAKADLFISIHANANRSRWIRGIEIYHARGKSEESISGLIYDRDYDYIFSGLNISKNSKNARAIVLDLIHTQNQSDALSLAQCIANSAEKNLEVRERGIRSASFYVLKNAQIPALLVEIGYITNAKEALDLKSNVYRQDIVEAIARGVSSYKERCLLGQRKK